MKKILDKLIQSLGKSNYHLDDSLNSSSILIILFNKSIEVIRGCFIGIFLHNSKGLLFIGKRVQLKFKNKINLGRSVTIGDYVQINALSKHGVQIGNNVSILRNTIIECTGVIRNLGEGLVIGNNVGIAQNCFIQVRGKVSIGNDVIFGPNVMIFSENHNFSDKTIPIVQQGETRLPVTIENNVWLGARSVILGGVTIGEGSIVAAGAVVNKDVPSFSIVAGVPAKIIKSRLN